MMTIEPSAITDALVADYAPQLKDDLSEEQSKQLMEDLSEITDGAEGGGSTDIVKGQYFIDLTGTAWAMLKAIVALGLAIAPDPTALTKLAAAKIVWDLIQNTDGAFRRLNEDEQEVARAIALKGGAHWRADSDHAVTIEDLKAHFTEMNAVMPPGLNEVLAGLEKKNVIKVDGSLEHTKTFKIAF